MFSSEAEKALLEALDTINRLTALLAEEHGQGAVVAAAPPVDTLDRQRDRLLRDVFERLGLAPDPSSNLTGMLYELKEWATETLNATSGRPIGPILADLVRENAELKQAASQSVARDARAEEAHRAMEAIRNHKLNLRVWEDQGNVNWIAAAGAWPELGGPGAAAYDPALAVSAWVEQRGQS